MSELYSNITKNYNDTIENIADMVLSEEDQDTDRSVTINNEISRQFFTYREDEDLLIAEMAKEGFIKFGEEPDWTSINEQIYADVLRAIDEKEKEDESVES